MYEEKRLKMMRKFFIYSWFQFLEMMHECMFICFNVRKNNKQNKFLAKITSFEKLEQNVLTPNQYESIHKPGS